MFNNKIWSFLKQKLLTAGGWRLSTLLATDEHRQRSLATDRHRRTQTKNQPSHKSPVTAFGIVILAKAGIQTQSQQSSLDSRLRGNDESTADG